MNAHEIFNATIPGSVRFHGAYAIGNAADVADLLVTCDEECGRTDIDAHDQEKVALVTECGVFFDWATEDEILAASPDGYVRRDGALYGLDIVTWHDHTCPESCPFDGDGYTTTSVDDLDDRKAHILNQRATA